MNVIVNLESNEAHLAVTRDELATIWYALDEYAKNLKKTIEKSEHSSNEFEDKVFCYEVLSKISKLQFDLVENHSAPMSTLIREWMDV